MEKNNAPLSPAEAALRDAALDYHRTPTRGKISVTPTKALSNQRDLSLAYSPGVAYPCLDIERDPSSPSTPITVDFASCTLPLTTTTCTRSAAPTMSTARNSLTGTGPCLAPLAGTFPAGRGINSPAPACFASDSVATLVIDLAGTPIRLRNAQVAAHYNADPATVLQTGLISGFYPLTEANNTRLPPTIAIVGGRTIASLLRASDQDRLSDGTVGWWFYLNFTASPVRYVP